MIRDYLFHQGKILAEYSAFVYNATVTFNVNCVGVPCSWVEKMNHVTTKLWTHPKSCPRLADTGGLSWFCFSEVSRITSVCYYMWWAWMFLLHLLLLESCDNMGIWTFLWKKKLSQFSVFQETYRRNWSLLKLVVSVASRAPIKSGPGFKLMV